MYTLDNFNGVTEVSHGVYTSARTPFNIFVLIDRNNIVIPRIFKHVLNKVIMLLV